MPSLYMRIFDRNTAPMHRYRHWRRAGPGAWLVAALVADVGTYLMSARLNFEPVRDARPSQMFPLLLLDVLLALRIWQGVGLALFTFRVLQTFEACMSGYIAIGSALDGQTAIGTSPGIAALNAVAAWCLTAPALQRYVDSKRRVSSRPADREAVAPGP